MIANCQSCHRPFWRYRRDYPPKGFCSLPCFAVGRKSGPPEAPPIRPEAVLFNMRAHRRSDHGTTSILGWFPDCPLCEELETDYAASLEYHWRVASEQIAEQAKARWAYETGMQESTVLTAVGDS